MKRCVLLILLFLLLGAIVNIAVAWGCILRRPYLGAGPTSDGQKGGTWELQVPATWPAAPYGYWNKRGIGWNMRENTSEPIDAFVNYIETPPIFNTYVWRCGWPMHSLTSIIVTQDITGKTPRRGTYNELAVGIVIPEAILKLANWDLPCLPTKPDPIGFTVNTLFYAAIPTIPFLLAGPVRRARRFRAGLCPRCRYPIATSPVCTECGHAIPARKPSVTAQSPPA